MILESDAMNHETIQNHTYIRDNPGNPIYCSYFVRSLYKL